MTKLLVIASILGILAVVVIPAWQERGTVKLPRTECVNGIRHYIDASRGHKVIGGAVINPASLQPERCT